MRAPWHDDPVAVDALRSVVATRYVMPLREGGSLPGVMEASDLGAQEVQDLLRASGGLNLGMDLLPGALGFDPVAHSVPAELASQVLCAAARAV